MRGGIDEFLKDLKIH